MQVPLQAEYPHLRSAFINEETSVSKWISFVSS